MISWSIVFWAFAIQCCVNAIGFRLVERRITKLEQRLEQGETNE